MSSRPSDHDSSVAVAVKKSAVKKPAKPTAKITQVAIRTIAITRVPAKGEQVVKAGRAVLKTSAAYGTRSNWYKGLDFESRAAATAYAKKAGLRIVSGF